MYKAVCLLFLFAAVISASVQMIGCSAAGYAIGSSIDEGNARTDTLRNVRLRDLQPGTDVTVMRKDGTRQDGYFIGMQPAPQTTYRRWYDDWLAGCSVCPFNARPGDTLTVDLNTGESRRRRGEFMGFTSSSILLRTRASGGNAQSTVLQNFNMVYVDSVIDGKGRSITGSDLQKTLSAGQVPINTSLALLVSSDTVYIPAYTVDNVIGYRSTTPGIGKAVGTGVGIGIDVLLIAAVIVAVSFAVAIASIGH